MAWKLCFIINICVIISKCSIRASTWNLVKGQLMTGYEKGVDARSKIDCIRICHQFSHCISVAYDVISGKCYLHPSSSLSSENSMVYVVKGVSISNASVTWTRTLTSLVGDVTCDLDFIWTGNASFIRCLATGMWEQDGVCKQHIWRNATQNGLYVIPRTVVDGWSICLEGIPVPQNGQSISINIGSATTDVPLHIDLRFQTATRTTPVTVINQKINNRWLSELQIHFFPFVMGQPFQMKITLRGNVFQVTVNGQLYASRKQIFPLAAIAIVYVQKEINLTFLDIWCSH